jgi:hypothetical protein
LAREDTRGRPQSKRHSGNARPVDRQANLFSDPDGHMEYERKVRTGTLGGAVKRANSNLAAKDLPPLPDSPWT